MRIPFILPLFSLLFAFVACAREPGPAERLGRTIDQLTNDVQDISREYGESDDSWNERKKAAAHHETRDDSWKTRPYDEPARR